MTTYGVLALTILLLIWLTGSVRRQQQNLQRTTSSVTAHKFSQIPLKALFCQVSLPTRYQTNFIAVSRVSVQNIWAIEAATANEA